MPSTLVALSSTSACSSVARRAAQVSVVKKLDGLFETYSDKEPYDDRGNVEEEAVPSAQCFMRCVDF